MAFPTIAPPSKINGTPSFNTISSEFEGGYELTRERNTRSRKLFKVDYVSLTRVDTDLLQAHFDTVRGSTSFDWENVDTGITHTVRYAKAVGVPREARMPNRYNMSIEVKEV